MIYGINPNSLIDYPGELSFVVFTGGCNFNCPYCHNKDIVNKNTSTYSNDEILSMLDDRKKLIDSVTITGGEPTIYGYKLIDFIKKIKDLGYKVKLDTNGSNPALIKKIIDNNLIDFIAMDIKNTFTKYYNTIDKSIALDNIKNSIKIIQNSNINYEFRTTVNKTMHSKEDILEIMSYIKDKSKFKLQPYKNTKQQIKDFHFSEWSVEELDNIIEPKVSV